MWLTSSRELRVLSFHNPFSVYCNDETTEHFPYNVVLEGMAVVKDCCERDSGLLLEENRIAERASMRARRGGT